MSRYVDLDDYSHCFCGHDGEYEKWNIDPDAVIPTIEPEPKTGKWGERKVSNERVIDEWQSARCSVCEKYHTTPYMYYFDDFNFCPNCGSRMER